jgi:hypothetical protein
MSKPKNPTPQAISSLLRKAGFEKSVTSTTRVRGYRAHSWGFVVRPGSAEGTVLVHHETGWFRPSDESRRQQAEIAAQYADRIEAAGYTVRRDEGSYFGPLVISAVAEEG